MKSLYRVAPSTESYSGSTTASATSAAARPRCVRCPRLEVRGAHGRQVDQGEVVFLRQVAQSDGQSPECSYLARSPLAKPAQGIAGG